MRIHLVAVGTRMPGWVDEGFREFARRLPSEVPLELREIPAGRRGKGIPPARAIAEEGSRMLGALPKEARVVALEVDGRPWSTADLARQLRDWQTDGRDIALLVGGPDGLAPECRARAVLRWSLSPLTLPHALVRVVIAEQIYRAWSINAGHPYHRE